MSIARPPEVIRGVLLYRGLLAQDDQQRILAAIEAVIAQAPLFTPHTPNGRPMSVRMTSAGRYGWYSDRAGYRYIDCQPNGRPWPAVPPAVLAIWNRLAPDHRSPQCCLVNVYGETSRMGLHRDCDEQDFSCPVVSISLGDSARFRIGNLQRGGPTESVWLHSGDVVVMGGRSRKIYHGIDRTRFASSDLVPSGGRINLTLRVVDQPPE